MSTSLLLRYSSGLEVILLLVLAIIFLSSVSCQKSVLSAVKDATNWQLRGLSTLDGLGSGRYTQIRVGSDGLATIVWNGNNTLRLARCTDSICDSVTKPISPLNASGLHIINPRFIRMELSGVNPVLVFSTANDTEAHVMTCNDPFCTDAETTVLVKAREVRHCDMVMMSEKDLLPVITFGLSGYLHHGSVLIVFYAEAQVFHQVTTQVWKNVIVATSATPFGVNETSGMPTGGLEMPSMVAVRSNVNGGRSSVHLVYWDVTQQQTVLVLHMFDPHPRRVALKACAWPRIVHLTGDGNDDSDSDDGVIVVACFDLERDDLISTTCTDAGLCGEVTKWDNVGRGDITDFGAGAFPAFGTRHGDTTRASLVYFSQQGDVGYLKILEFDWRQITNNSKSNNGSSVSVLSSGRSGFGRDASLAFVPGSAGNIIFVSFLDLDGNDELGSMRARLGVYMHKKRNVLIDNHSFAYSVSR